jgi:hypothetical protein
MSSSPEYRVWMNMRRRCHDRRHKSFKRYGARKIRVCRRWRLSFVKFFGDVGPRPSPKHSLERLKNDLGYEPGNVVWATASDQAQNREHAISVEFRGQVMNLAAACRLAGQSYNMVLRRLKRGWGIERALVALPLKDGAGNPL